MNNKYQTLACPQASSTRASGPLRKKHLMSSSALAGLVLALAPASQAATITWDSAVLIKDVGDAVISTEGSLVTAYDFGSLYTYNYDKTVNGVIFDHRPYNAVPPGFAEFNNNSNSSLPTDPNSNMVAHFEELLWGHTNQDAGGDGISDIELQGLVNGESYLVQFLVHDPRSTGGNSWDQTFTGGANTSPALDARDTYSLVGRFVAVGTTQAIRIADTNGIHDPAPTGLQNPMISAVQWREVAAVPEPSTFALAALGLMGLVGLRRRRNKA